MHLCTYSPEAVWAPLCSHLPSVIPICQRIWVGNESFAAEQLAPYHFPHLPSEAFLHDSFLLYVQMVHYGQPHLACLNKQRCFNTAWINARQRGARLRRIDCTLCQTRLIRALLLLLLCGAKCRCHEDGDAWRRCCCRVRETEEEKGKVRYDVKSIQVGERAQVAGSCRGMDAQSIRTPVPDKAQDYRCLRGENRNRNAWMASQTHR